MHVVADTVVNGTNTHLLATFLSNQPTFPLFSPTTNFPALFVFQNAPLHPSIPPQEVEKFLAGANSMDDHFRETPLESNLPVLMGLISVWNISFLGYPARAILPYCQVGVVCCLFGCHVSAGLP